MGAEKELKPDKMLVRGARVHNLKNRLKTLS